MHYVKGKKKNEGRDEGILYERTSHVTQAAKGIHMLLAINFLVNFGDIAETITINLDKA
jgi:hypothetical protein